MVIRPISIHIGKQSRYLKLLVKMAQNNPLELLLIQFIIYHSMMGLEMRIQYDGKEQFNCETRYAALASLRLGQMKSHCLDGYRDLPLLLWASVYIRGYSHIVGVSMHCGYPCTVIGILICIIVGTNVSSVVGIYIMLLVTMYCCGYLCIAMDIHLFSHTSFHPFWFLFCLCSMVYRCISRSRAHESPGST